jgi:hypothetical protein
VSLRGFVFENIIGDLEYHPRRAVIYLVFAGASAAVWGITPSDANVSLAPLVFGTGAVALLLKGIFLLRKTSDGLSVPRTLDYSQQQSTAFSVSERPKRLPSVPVVAAQLVQDFGVGGLLLGPFLHSLNNVDPSRINAPTLGVIVVSASVFMLG